MPKKKPPREIGPDDDGYTMKMRERLRSLKLQEEKDFVEERAVSETKVDDLIAKEADDAKIAGLNTMWYLDRYADQRKFEEEHPDTQTLRKKYEGTLDKINGVEKKAKETKVRGKSDRGYLEMSKVQDIDDIFASARAPPVKRAVSKPGAVAGVAEEDYEEEEEEEDEGIADYLEALQRQSAIQSKVSNRVVKSPQQRKEDYEETKENLYLATGGLGILGTGVSFAMSGMDAAFSFGLGSIGALYYLSGLSAYADAAETPMGQVMGGRRLVVPVILVLIVTQWEKICLRVPELSSLGLHPELLPVLLGFFTYVIGKVASSLLPKKEKASEQA